MKPAIQSEDIGVDGNQKIKGHKRHLLVDILGWLMAVVVTSKVSTLKKGDRSLHRH